jgi:DNA replication and repair protein RecF
MKFERLSVRQFRNIESQVLDLNPGLNVFRGQNGQGKTNLVESIYLLTHGKSFRTTRWDDLVNKNDFQGFYIQALVEKKGLQNKIELKCLNNRKSLKMNDQALSAPRLRQAFPSLLFSPESLLVVKDSAQKRRELIDDLCLSLFPQFAQLFADVRKVLKQKNTLLKKIKDEQISNSEGIKINESLTQILFEKGSLLTHFRIRAIEEIEPYLLQEFLQIMDEHYGNISINYFVSGHKMRGVSREELLNAMYKRWEELKSRELASGLCLVGPHKHDIQFDFNGQEARFFCSQGQQRAIILAFKMAQTRLHYRAHNEFPILLLDDVLSELDREKQMRFVNYLLSTRAQIFLTTTDATSIPQVASRSVFEVRNGVFGESDRLLTGGLSV